MDNRLAIQTSLYKSSWWPRLRPNPTVTRGRRPQTGASSASSSKNPREIRRRCIKRYLARELGRLYGERSAPNSGLTT